MSAIDVEHRPLAAADEAAAAAILVAGAEVNARRGGARIMPDAAKALVVGARAADPHGAIVGTIDGKIVSVGFARRRGEVAAIGPLAVAEPGQGHGGVLLDELLSRVEHAGATGVRALVEGANPEAFALLASRAFAPIDTACRLFRAPGAPPKIDAARGLEVAPPTPADAGALAELDLRLTGLERPAVLAKATHVARRRGAIVGFLVGAGGVIGPAVALDVVDLAGLVARALPATPALTLASTAAGGPALLALFALGFRVLDSGTVLSRGVGPPARPPQLYGIDPELF